MDLLGLIMRSEERHSDPLLRGFYTVSEAARLLRLRDRQSIYRWLSRDNPVIVRDFEPLDGSQELSFWDLFEVRFVETFRTQGLSLQYLRKVAVKARIELKTDHPFALSDARYMTDRKRIFRVTAEETREKTHDMLSGQYEMYEAIERILSKGVVFNPTTLLAEEWVPFAECPNVVINPRYAYGQPVVGKQKVPTAALYRLFRAEGRIDRVASWYGVKPKDAEDAVEFEVKLAA